MFLSSFMMLERSEKLSDNCRKCWDVPVGVLKKCWKFETVLVSSSQSELERKNHSESKVNTMKFPQDPNLKREWFIKMKRIDLLSCPFVQNILPKAASNKFIYYRKGFLLGPSFKLRQLVFRKDPVPTIFNFPMESYNPTIGQKPTKNKRIIPAEQRATSSAFCHVK